MVVALERAEVPVSPAAEEPVPEGGVPLTDPDAEPETDGDVLLVDDDVEPDSLGVVPPAAEDGEVVVVADDELPGAGAVAVGGGVVTVVDELDEGACELGGVVCWRLSVLSQAANPRRHADTATISFMMLFLHRVKVANDKTPATVGCFTAR